MPPTGEYVGTTPSLAALDSLQTGPGPSLGTAPSPQIAMDQLVGA